MLSLISLKALSQSRSHESLLPPVTKVWAGPDCESKDDAACASRQKKNCIQLIRLPEETFDVKCAAKGEGIEQVTLEKYEYVILISYFSNYL